MEILGHSLVAGFTKTPDGDLVLENVDEHGGVDRVEIIGFYDSRIVSVDGNLLVVTELFPPESGIPRHARMNVFHDPFLTVLAQDYGFRRLPRAGQLDGRTSFNGILDSGCTRLLVLETPSRVKGSLEVLAPVREL